MSRFRLIALLFALLIGTILWAGEVAPPSKEVTQTEFGDQHLKPKWEIVKGDQTDTLLMSEQAAKDTIATEEAQTSMAGVEIDIDKKIIRPQTLGLSAGYTLQEILELMPELLERGNENMLSRYTLQVDDIGVGQSQDVVLKSLRAEEIDYIEITHLPTVSVQQNGEGGVINVHLKPIEKDFHGSAMADVYTNFHNTADVSPSVYFTYGGEKWQLRTNLVMEYYHPLSSQQTQTRIHDMDIANARDTGTLTTDTTVSHNLQQTAKVQFDYQPTSQDALTLSVWESTQWETALNQSHTTTFRPLETADMPLLWQQSCASATQKNIANKYTITARAKYKRLYLLGGELQADVVYNYGYNKNTSDKSFAASDETAMGQQTSYTTDCPQELQVNIQSKHAIAPERLGIYDSEMWLTYGINSSYMHRASRLNQYAGGTTANDYRQDLGLNKQQVYVSPMLQWDYQIGSVKLQAGVRYQMQHRRLLTDTKPEVNHTEHDWTGSLNASWAITRKHTLQLNIARNILRPEDEQLFSHPYYLPISNELIVGNDSLHAAYFHNIGVNYLFRYPFQQKDNGRLVLHVSVDYIRADGLIQQQGRMYEYQYGALPYKTFVNQESSNVLSMNGSLFLRYRIFSMSVAGNMYLNSKAKDDYYWYYNLSLSPCFAFKKQWLLSGKLIYNSRIETRDSYIGDCFYVQLRLSKQIGKWTIHAGVSDIFDMRTVDRKFSTTEVLHQENGLEPGNHTQYAITERIYDLYKRLFVIGVVYGF